MNPFAPFIAILRVLSGFMALGSAFGFLFFLSSQGVLMSLYTATSVTALAYFSFSSRRVIATASGWWVVVLLSAAASLFTLAKLYTDVTHPHGAAPETVGFRVTEMIIFIVMVLESQWLRQHQSENAV